MFLQTADTVDTNRKYSRVLLRENVTVLMCLETVLEFTQKNPVHN